MTDFQNNPIPHLFVGKWEVTAKRSVSGTHSLFEINFDGDSTERYILKDLPNTSSRKTESTPLKLILNSDQLNLVAEGSKQVSCSISFWRNTGYDVIFGTEYNSTKEPIAVWSARRQPWTPPSSKGPEDHIGKEFNVVLRRGPGARSKHSHITLREIGHKQGDGFQSDSIYGLFYRPVGSSKAAAGDFRLYDLMNLDPTANCLNSVFGVRSLSWDNENLFATFNNRASLPTVHLHPANSTFLGLPLPFEVATPCPPTSGNEGDRPGINHDDPDVGVWVGVPLPPPERA